MGFAPVDTIDDALLAGLRARFGRVSAERVLSGPALAGIYEHLAAMEGRAIRAPDDHTLWAAALDGSDALAVAALQRFCLSLGSFAGRHRPGPGCTGHRDRRRPGCPVGRRAAGIGLCGPIRGKGAHGGAALHHPRQADHPPAARPVRRRGRLRPGTRRMREQPARSAAAYLATLLLLSSCSLMQKPVLTGADQGDLARITAYLNGMPRFEAHFTQTGSYGPGAGLIWLDRPGHLRIDYAGAGARVMVIADGRVRILDRSTGALTTMPVSRTPLGLLLAPTISLAGAAHVDSLVRPGRRPPPDLEQRGTACSGTVDAGLRRPALGVASRDRDGCLPAHADDAAFRHRCGPGAYARLVPTPCRGTPNLKCTRPDAGMQS